MDNIYKFCHDQIHSLALEPTQICQYLVITFGEVTGLPADSKHYSWKYMRHYFRALRMNWDDILYNDGWRKYSAVENLWNYCKTWFCDKRMGGIIYQRARLVKQEFQFSPHEAPATNNHPFYGQRAVTQIDEALKELHRYQKGLRPRGDNDEYKGKGTTAGGKYKHGTKDKSKSDYKNDDDLKQNEYSTAGGNQCGFDDNEHSTARGKQYEFKDDKYSAASGKQQCNDDQLSTAGGNQCGFNDNKHSTAHGKQYGFKDNKYSAASGKQQFNDDQHSTAGGKQCGFKDNEDLTRGAAKAKQPKDEDSKAGGKYKHGAKDKGHLKAVDKGLKGVIESDEDDEEDDCTIKPIIKIESDMDLCESEFSFI